MSAGQQLPPGPSWFRLASLARTEATAASAASNNPPPPLPARIPVPRSQQQPPPATPLAAPAQPPPLQPPPPPPPESPKVISPSYSAAPPPSIGQKPNPGPEPAQNNNVPEQGKFLNGKESKEINGKEKEEEERRLITIAGKNIGARMEFGFGSISEERNNGEGKEAEVAVKAKPKRLVVNSNVQSINNSIVLNTTFKQHSPGVHVNFARALQLKGSQATENYWSTDEQIEERRFT